MKSFSGAEPILTVLIEYILTSTREIEHRRIRALPGPQLARPPQLYGD